MVPVIVFWEARVPCGRHAADGWSWGADTVQPSLDPTSPSSGPSPAEQGSEHRPSGFARADTA